MCLDAKTDAVLNIKQAAHLLRRCSFHFTIEKVNELVGQYAEDAVDALFDQPIANELLRPVHSYIYKENGNNKFGAIDWINQQDGAIYSSAPTTIEDLTVRRRAVAGWWLYNALKDPGSHHKCAFFLHTIFSTSHENLLVPALHNDLSSPGYFHRDLKNEVSRFLYDHLSLLDWLTVNSSLKVAARKITLDNLMLCYLDNRTNVDDGSPDDGGVNENYAREFLELFTIGKEPYNGNITYTEADITEAAKIFSGFTTHAYRNTSPIDGDTNLRTGIPIPVLHINGEKAFSASFDNQIIDKSQDTNLTEVEKMEAELDEFINMVFSQEATAFNYAKKIYRFFIAPEELGDSMSTEVADVVNCLADYLYDNDSPGNYDFMGAIKMLLKSEYFYNICNDAGNTGGNILKSPIELLTECMSFCQTDFPPLPILPDTNGLYDFSDYDDDMFRQLYYHSRSFAVIYLFKFFGDSSGMLLFGPPDVAGYPAYYDANLDFDLTWYTGGTIGTRHNLGKKFITDFNITPRFYTEIDTVIFAQYLAAQGIDMTLPDVLVNEITNYLFSQTVSMDRRDLIRDIFTDGLGTQTWANVWDGGGGEPEDMRPHLDALFTAILSAQEFQLK